MDLKTVLVNLGISLGLGLLVGLQRERTHSPLAGFRTFPLISVAGTLCALLAREFGGWVVVAGLCTLAAMIVVGNLAALKSGTADPGLTTEVAMLVMFGVGAYLVAGHRAAAIAVGAGLAVLLHLKPQMQAVATRIGDKDFKSIMQFVLISLVILPVLPDEAYGPFRVLNPFRIWLMVVLIVGISLAGYLAYKLLGPRAGTLAGGVLGGLVSSTATTVSYARRSRQAPGLSRLAALVIVVASAVVFVRVLILISAVARDFLGASAPPIGAMCGVLVVIAAGAWFANRRLEGGMPELGNPTELRPALFFAGLYAAVLLAVAAARDWLGEAGMYTVAVFSGLTDMDAITLSVSQLVSAGEVAAETGWRLILVAAMANLVFKTAVVAALGGRPLLRQIGICFGLAFVAGGFILWLWPG